MNRLKKIALIDSQIKLQDVDFLIGQDKIEIYLTNEDVALHIGQQEDPEYYKTPSKEISGSEIGFINWEAKGKQFLFEGDHEEDYKEMYYIYINFLEIRQEYRQTKCMSYLLDKFMETVVNPAIEDYGKDNVVLNASFANDQLGRVVVKKLKKMNIQWFDDLDIADIVGEANMNRNRNTAPSSQEMQEGFSQKGIESTIENDKIVIINQPMGKTLEACLQLRSTNVTGTITLNGDFKLALGMGRGVYPSGDGFNFDYYFFGGGMKFKDVQSIEEIKSKITNISNLINNLNVVMSDSQEVITVGNEYYYGKEFIDALNENSQQNTASKLRKRLIK